MIEEMKAAEKRVMELYRRALGGDREVLAGLTVTPSVSEWPIGIAEPRWVPEGRDLLEAIADRELGREWKWVVVHLLGGRAFVVITGAQDAEKAHHQVFP